MYTLSSSDPIMYWVCYCCYRKLYTYNFLWFCEKKVQNTNLLGENAIRQIYIIDRNKNKEREKEMKGKLTLGNNARKEFKIIFVVVIIMVSSLPSFFTFAFKIERLPCCCLATPFPTLHIFAYFLYIYTTPNIIGKFRIIKRTQKQTINKDV